ncbi:hypothetical protein HMPREF0731_3770 [Pseudoroseomonas cervicalis ATCC 49957]|uniref:Uncharacterized protein n=1 Tax=Pseudoroseomonas cervicalis ATCC 49957 TaxID=525371 RepID=D5RRQ8_9PROT|nr:hypothetical protein HMPREF0731_3770 [Pseudoroseomonas cervicalis ATCC 49957]
MIFRHRGPHSGQSAQVRPIIGTDPRHGVLPGDGTGRWAGQAMQACPARHGGRTGLRRKSAPQPVHHI